MKKGAQLILEERERQVSKERWTPTDDDEYKDGQLALAAICYAADSHGDVGARLAANVDGLWPWADEWWKPTTAIRGYVKAAALLAAEIDRLQRIEAMKMPDDGTRKSALADLSYEPAESCLFELG